ncbi:PorV/PorQ family protein [candidate division KSB1 bacterium]
MKNIQIKMSLIFTIVCISFNVYAQENIKGFAFLRIGTGGRAAGMGEAYTAAASGAEATFWNPALMSSENNNSVVLAHTEWLEDIRIEFLGFSFSKGKLNFGISINSNTVSDIEKRSNPVVTPEGYFSAGDFFVGLSASYKLKENLKIGITGKYLYQKIYIEEASGYAFDLGAGYDMPGINLKLGAVVKNIGSVNALKDEKTPLPSLFRIGAVYMMPDLSENISLLFSTDVEKLFDSSISSLFDYFTYHGLEAAYKEKMFLRAGYQSGFEARGISFGLGVKIKKYNFDYGFQPFSFQMGSTHRLSFLYNF